MMRNEAGSDSTRDGSKANGSDSTERAAEEQSSGNGLVQEFSKITDPKVLAPGGGSDQPDVVRATSPESGSGTQAGAALVKIEKPVTSSMDSSSDAKAAIKQDGGARQSAAGELGKCKTTGISGAFPSSAELLQGLKM